MSRFELKPRSRSTLTSTHRPWQSNPFWKRWSSPSIAWKRQYTSLYVRPQAWWTPIGLLAVIGPSRKLQRGPLAFWARNRSNVRRSRHRSRISYSCATKSGFEVTGRNIRPQGCGELTRWQGAGLIWAGPSILPAMHETQGARPRARSPFAAAFLSWIFPGLGQLYAGAPMRALAFAAAPILFIAAVAGVVLRLDRIELLGLVLNPFVLSSVFVLNLLVLIYRVVAIVDAVRVAEYMNRYAAAGHGRLGPGRSRPN